MAKKLPQGVVVALYRRADNRVYIQERITPDIIRDRILGEPMPLTGEAADAPLPDSITHADYYDENGILRETELVNDDIRKKRKMKKSFKPKDKVKKADDDAPRDKPKKFDEACELPCFDCIGWQGQACCCGCE